MRQCAPVGTRALLCACAARHRSGPATAPVRLAGTSHPRRALGCTQEEGISHADPPLPPGVVEPDRAVGQPNDTKGCHSMLIECAWRPHVKRWHGADANNLSRVLSGKVDPATPADVTGVDERAQNPDPLGVASHERGRAVRMRLGPCLLAIGTVDASQLAPSNAQSFLRRAHARCFGGARFAMDARPYSPLRRA